MEQVANADSNDRKGQLDRVRRYRFRGSSFIAQGDLARAQEFHQRAYEIVVQLTEHSPDEKWALNERCVSCFALGSIFRRQRNFEKASEFFNKTREIMQRLLETQPYDPKNEANLAYSYFNVAGVLERLGDAPMAHCYDLQAFSILERLAALEVDDRFLYKKLSSFCQEAGMDLERRSKRVTASLFYLLRMRVEEKLDGWKESDSDDEM